MKQLLFILLTFTTVPVLAQPYTDNDKLLIPAKHFIFGCYIVQNDSIAYYDWWGSNKYMTYFFIDTFRRTDGTTYIGTSNMLLKQGNSWELTDLQRNSIMTFKTASDSAYNEWARLINDLRYWDVESEVSKLEHTNNIIFEQMKEDLTPLDAIAIYDKNKTHVSIDEYQRQLNEIVNKYSDHIAYVPIKYFKPLPDMHIKHDLTTHSSRKRSKK